MNTILEISNVSKCYKDFSLQNINLTLERGYIMGFIGPNGAGKSTTIKLIMNLIRADSGNIKIFGMSHEQNGIAIKERIGFVYDENYFYEELTVREMKGIIRPYYKRWNEQIFEHYTNVFDLPIHKPIKHLSKGMRMKFALAIALSHEAELLVMDEPTSGLDPLVRAELLEILQSLMEDDNKAVFFSTHITSDLDKIADYITMINGGKIVLSDTKEELLDKYCIVKGGNHSLSDAEPDMFISLRQHKFGFEALSGNKEEVVKKWGDSVIIERPTLEDILVFSARGGDRHVSAY